MWLRSAWFASISFRFGAKNQNMCATYLPFILPTLHAGKLRKVSASLRSALWLQQEHDPFLYTYSTGEALYTCPRKDIYSWLNDPDIHWLGDWPCFCGSGHRFNHGDTWRRLFSVIHWKFLFVLTQEKSCLTLLNFRFQFPGP